MKILPTLLAVPGLAALSGCIVHVSGGGSSWGGGFHGLRGTTVSGLRGDGQSAVEDRALAEFDRVAISGAFRVRLAVGGAAGVRLSGDANLLEHIATRVEDGVLKIRHERPLAPVVPLELEVSAPALSELVLSGASAAELVGLAGDAFELSLSGSNRIVASGRVDRLRLASSGSQAIDLHELVVREATVDLSGSTRIRLHVEEEVAIVSSGSSSVRLGGGAELKSLRRSGTLSVEREVD